MITDKNKYEIIHKYFKGELNEETKAAFAQKYQTNGAFRKEVDEFKMISGTFKNLSRDSVDKIEEYLAQEDSREKAFPTTIHLRNYRRTFAIAASIAVLVAVGIYFIVNEHETDIAETGQIQIPVYASDNFGFTENKENIIDSVTVQFHQNTELAGYYSFSDRLHLYFEDKMEEYKNISIHRIEGNYYLTFSGMRYEIKRGFSQPQKLIKSSN